jgi:hypothetical protein
VYKKRKYIEFLDNKQKKELKINGNYEELTDDNISPVLTSTLLNINMSKYANNCRNDKSYVCVKKCGKYPNKKDKKEKYSLRKKHELNKNNDGIYFLDEVIENNNNDNKNGDYNRNFNHDYNCDEKSNNDEFFQEKMKRKREKNKKDDL